MMRRVVDTCELLVGGMVRLDAGALKLQYTGTAHAANCGTGRSGGSRCPCNGSDSVEWNCVFGAILNFYAGRRFATQKFSST